MLSSLSKACPWSIFVQCHINASGMECIAVSGHRGDNEKEVIMMSVLACSECEDRVFEDRVDENFCVKQPTRRSCRDDDGWTLDFLNS